MAINTRGTDTMADILQKVLQDITSALTLPDADIEFLTALQTIIIKKLREPTDMLAQMQGQQNPSSPPQPGPPMAQQPQAQMQMQVPPPGAVPPGPGGVPGVMSSPNMAPAADELRRVISGGR